VSRDLKYRAWDVFNHCFYWSDNHKNLAMFFAQIQKCIDGGNHVTVQQFVGRKDNNGVDMFGDDIARVQITNDVSAIGLICFKDGSFCIKQNLLGVDRYTNLNAYAPTCTFEIIGNTHESPELESRE